MNSGSTRPPAVPPSPRKRRDGVPRLRLDGIGREARQLAAVVLEVLAGVRTPMAAAQALGVSLPRYYAVELRALEGLVAACAPRPKGRVRSAASELAALQRECEQLRRDCARQQALVRASQRTIGLTAPPPPSPRPGKKRHSRKPTVRALKAARLLREETPNASCVEMAAATPS
jgi:hypothetical protein